MKERGSEEGEKKEKRGGGSCAGNNACRIANRTAHQLLHLEKKKAFTHHSKK
jgi:hypothetical protein